MNHIDYKHKANIDWYNTGERTKFKNEKKKKEWEYTYHILEYIS